VKNIINFTISSQVAGLTQAFFKLPDFLIWWFIRTNWWNACRRNRQISFRYVTWNL